MTEEEYEYMLHRHDDDCIEYPEAEEEQTEFEIAFEDGDSVGAYDIAYEEGRANAYSNFRSAISSLADDSSITDKDTVIEFLKRQFGTSRKFYNEIKAEMIAEGKIK